VDLAAASNKVTAIEGLDAFTALTFLELGSNRIPAVTGLDAAAGSLRELWLGRNRLTTLAGLAPLTRLERLSLQSNRLASMRDLPPLPHLRELYLSHNGITSLESLANLPSLRVLDVAANDVACVAGLRDCQAPLTDLWLNDNARLPDRAALLAALAGTPAAASLTCVYLAATPAAAGSKAEYVSDLEAALPALECVDGDDLPPRGRRVGTA
jgi:protein phosphatase 1 regulatory subunit 7